MVRRKKSGTIGTDLKLFDYDKDILSREQSLELIRCDVDMLKSIGKDSL